jgi:hypothetical protein
MFKTDIGSLEQLSFDFTEKDIANFKAILKHLKSNNFLTISPEEIQNALQSLDAIGKLKLDGKIYAFHVEDSCARKQYPGDGGEGVELYLRQGNQLEEFLVSFSRDFVYQTDKAIQCLKKHKISTIYTGEIPRDSEFLGLSYECDPEDPIIKDVLNEDEIAKFESKEIKVVLLDSLI